MQQAVQPSGTGVCGAACTQPLEMPSSEIVSRNCSQSVLIHVRLEKMALQCHLLLMRGILSGEDVVNRAVISIRKFT
jgi:hypothetical protein